MMCIDRDHTIYISCFRIYVKATLSAMTVPGFHGNVSAHSDFAIMTVLKGILHFFLEIGSFYHSPRVKQLGFTVFKSIQLIF